MDFLEAEVVAVAPARSYAAYAVLIQMHRDIVEAVVAGDITCARAAANLHSLSVFDNFGTALS